MTELAEDVLLPPLPGEVYGWGRFRRVLWKHSTALLELVAGLSSLLRGITLVITTPSAWAVAVALGLVGGVQVWAVVQRKARLRAWIALASMLVSGFTAALDLLLWQGYIGAVFAQGLIVLRAGPLFRLHNGQLTGPSE